eukprot:jgi/Chrzof1/4450/Cz14g13180.t1
MLWLQVLFKGDSGCLFKMPAALLSLYSRLFDDLFQGMLEEQDDQQLPQVPVPGVNDAALKAVLQWMMGLTALGAKSAAELTHVYRAADVLIMDELKSECLMLLNAAQISPDAALALMKLAGDLPDRPELQALGDRAECLLRARINSDNVTSIMEMAVKYQKASLQVVEDYFGVGISLNTPACS